MPSNQYEIRDRASYAGSTLAPVSGSERPKVPEPVSHRHIGDDVANYLRELIMTGHLRSGEFLRLERFAQEIGISNTPVRDALLSLRAEGFVVLEPRRGFVVAPLSAEDIGDLFLVQAMIAGELATRATKELTDERFGEIAAIHDRLEAARDDSADQSEQLNFEFHRAINRTASSPKLKWMLSRAVRYAPRLFYGEIRGWREASVNDHEKILGALEKRDAAAAGALMQQHILHAGELLVEHLRVGRYLSAEPAE